jgi:hypothetical protein
MFQSLVAELNDERKWNTGTELDTHAQGKELEKVFCCCDVKCEDHESERKRKILIFRWMGVQWHQPNQRLNIKLNSKNCVAWLLGKVH